MLQLPQWSYPLRFSAKGCIKNFVLPHVLYSMITQINYKASHSVNLITAMLTPLFRFEYSQKFVLTHL